MDKVWIAFKDDEVWGVYKDPDYADRHMDMDVDQEFTWCITSYDVEE